MRSLLTIGLVIFGLAGSSFAATSAKEKSDVSTRAVTAGTVSADAVNFMSNDSFQRTAEWCNDNAQTLNMMSNAQVTFSAWCEQRPMYSCSTYTYCHTLRTQVIVH